VILLDTSALLWLHHGHRRARRLETRGERLYASPASLLEIQILLEAGRVRLRSSARVSDLVEDERWAVDDLPSLAWFDRSLEVGWTRDPFDRLLVAHARFRGWRVATSDGELVERLGPDASIEL
jgi:PIN domain nuclease of toxin-antitoxin system